MKSLVIKTHSSTVDINIHQSIISSPYIDRNDISRIISTNMNEAETAAITARITAVTRITAAGIIRTAAETVRRAERSRPAADRARADRRMHAAA